MNITFLIGNGFDLNFGIKTRYRDFYDYYLSQDIIVEIKNKEEKEKIIKCIKKFKSDLSENIENWSDLEIALGKYASLFDKGSEKEFIALLDNIQDCLADYIDMQDKEFNVSDSDKQKLLNDLVSFENYLTPSEKEKFLSYKNQYIATPYNVNVITFNYSKTFEKIYGWQGKQISISERKFNNTIFPQTIKSLYHIHGTTGSNMILGVNDISQLENEELKASIQTIRAIVKTELNTNAGTLRDRHSVYNISIAEVICVYGMSIGATDKYWWKTIIDRLKKSSCRLIIFSKTNEINPRRGYRAQNIKDEIVELFLSYSELSEIEIKKIKEQIFVCLNSKMFNARLSYAQGMEISPKFEIKSAELKVTKI